MQVCSRLSRLKDLVLLLASVAITYFCCNIFLSFSMITLSRQSFLYRNNFMCIPQQLCCKIDNHVVKQFQCSFCQLVSRPKFHVATGLCSCYVAILSCISCISVVTQKVCRDRGLLPLSLTSCFGFVLILRHDFLVLSIFAVATQFSCCDNTLLCSN